MRDEELNKTLIARLREIQGQAGLFASAAADRIEALIEESSRRLALARSEGVARVEQFERNEALTKELNTCRMAQAVMDNTVADLEAKLSKTEGLLAENEVRLRKAVKALELIVVDNTWGLEHQTYMKCRKALAEIKSGVATTPYGLEGESHE